MKRLYDKIAKAIEALQKYRADNGIEQNQDSYKALYAMRQTAETDEGEPK